MFWGVLGNFKRMQFVVELWMIRNKIKRSFARRLSTESFSLVFGDDCLQLPSLYYGDDLICSFVPNNDCRRWLPVDTWPGKNLVCPVPDLLSDPGGNLATPGRNNGIELNHPSSTVLRTTWILYCMSRSYLLASYEGCQWGWRLPLLGLRVWSGPGVHPQRGAK